MSVQYTVTVERTVDRVSNELVARNVTADQAIDLLLHIQRNFSDSEKEDALEEAQDEPEQVPKDEPTAPPKKSKAHKKESKPLSYDKDAIVADLKSGMPTAEIAAKHKVTKQTVYNVKHKAHLIPEPSREGELQPATTAYAQRQRERAAQKPEETDIDQEIRMMVVEGLSISELELMFPKVELTKITSIYRELRPIS